MWEKKVFFMFVCNESLVNQVLLEGYKEMKITGYELLV
jgi:hypothetical protein